MKQWLAIIGLGIAAFLFVFFVGTRPAEVPNNQEVKVDTAGKQWDKAPEMQIDGNKTYAATITTSKGVIKAQLFVKDAPKTVNNFVFLAKENFYNGVRFHRIIQDFMVQTGDPTGTGAGGPGYKFEDEKVTKNYDRGILAMANSGPNTNGSQFFIMTQNNTTLPKDYTIFGQIDAKDTESLTTLDAIAATPVSAGQSGEVSTPKEDVTITSVTIEEK